ncbi:autophagy-related protein 22-like protein [Phaeosphaeriaceae sp. PMI808]|nr:autophagy-related protein 22-like protein [Phaeosphaeriaceae sp. PMI808]
MTTEKEILKTDIGTITVAQADSSSEAVSSDHGEAAQDEDRKPMARKRALIAWMVLCFSTGPTSGMAFRYVPAVLQSAANVLGHIPGTNKPCAKRGVIRCVVPFGTGEVDYNSYILYLQSIARASEAYFRKVLLICAIVLFGTFALPFASLTTKTYRNLVTGSILWVFMTTIQGVYGTLSSSYIPLFMREAGWIQARTRIGQDGNLVVPEEERANKELFNRGTMVSVLGLLSGNVGSILGQGIGLAIAHTAGSGLTDGYKSFLLAITIAGCLTISFGGLGFFLLPSVKGSKPPSRNYGGLAVKRWVELLKSIPKYPEAFKLCVGWVLWNTGYSNFNSVIGLLFREVSGLGSGDRLYTVYTFMAVTTASIGSLTWMFVFPRTNIKIMHWAYGFLFVNIFCIFWGCLGIGKNVKIGYKYVPEFWIEQTLFCMTSSALRSANRVMYSSMLPRGREAHFFGLELTLDLATGWINPLVQSVIQNKTHNLRYPMLPNFFLLLAAIGFYIWCDLEKGIKDSLQEFDEAAPARDE